jgi:4-aminobutyrate aminotransferase-like enzyme
VSEIVERDLAGNARQMGARLRAGLEGLAQRHACVAEVRGEGLLLAVEFARGGRTREPFPAGTRFGARVHQAARRNGLLIREGESFVVVAPPLVVSEAEVDETVERLDRAIAEASSS